MVASHAPPTGDLACNPGLCPDWESNPQPFGLQAGAQSTEPQQPGCSCILFAATKIFMSLFTDDTVPFTRFHDDNVTLRDTHVFLPWSLQESLKVPWERPRREDGTQSRTLLPGVWGKPVLCFLRGENFPLGCRSSAVA